MVTPARMKPSLMRSRIDSSASESWARSLMPESVPSSGSSRVATGRRSARANATSSGRYSSPVTGDGGMSGSRWRSHATSKAYSPALISVMSSCVLGRVPLLDDALDPLVGVAHHPTEAARIERIDGGERDHGPLRRDACPARS